MTAGEIREWAAQITESANADSGLPVESRRLIALAATFNFIAEAAAQLAELNTLMRDVHSRSKAMEG